MFFKSALIQTSLDLGCNPRAASVTLSSRDAAQERTGMYLQRVTDAALGLHPVLMS